jgi:hypothetical protein
VSAFGRAGDVYWDIVEVVGMVVRDEAGVEALVMGNRAPNVRVLSCTVFAAEIFKVLIWFVIHGVVTVFWGFIRGPILLQVDTRELQFVVVIRFIGLIRVVIAVLWVLVFIKLVDVIQGVVLVTPIVWVVIMVFV